LFGKIREKGKFSENYALLDARALPYFVRKPLSLASCCEDAPPQARFTTRWL
jgi:hypothetical protein